MFGVLVMGFVVFDVCYSRGNLENIHKLNKCFEYK
jgi:hypothetical protein